MEDIGASIVLRTEQFRQQIESLRFSIDCIIYDPLDYAWDMHRSYLEKYVRHPVETLLLGMNPGPFGMAQTGVPFGEVGAVRDFLKLDGDVGRPFVEHPARPVLGMACPRSEVSGRRLWGLLKEHYQTADACFEHLCVLNYCPLLFLDRGKTGKNIPVDKIPRSEQYALEAVCNGYLRDMIALLRPRFLIGIGKYAEGRLQKVATGNGDGTVASILHPSPASPAANRGWAEQASAALVRLGVWTS